MPFPAYLNFANKITLYSLERSGPSKSHLFKYFLYCFIVTEVVLFTTLFSLVFYYFWAVPPQFAVALENCSAISDCFSGSFTFLAMLFTLSVLLITIRVTMLILSNIFYLGGSAASLRDCALSLAVCPSLFAALQFIEAASQNYWTASGFFYSLFYAIVSVHGAHVLIGAVLSVVLFVVCLPSR